MKKIRVAIAEDQELFRKSLTALLATETRVEVMVDLGNGAAFVEKIKELNVVPDIALIDLNLPGRNGFEITQILQKDFPTVHVIILSVYTHAQSVAKAIYMGASGYVSKNCHASELFETIFKVYEEGICLSKETLQRVLQAQHYRSTQSDFSLLPVLLTKREKEVLKLLCKEYTNTEIADNLYLSVRTVEGHRTNLLQKTGCKSVTGLVLFAVRYGIIDIPL